MRYTLTIWMMMYFLIEPVIAGVPYLNPMIISDDELAELLIKLMR